MSVPKVVFRRASDGVLCTGYFRSFAPEDEKTLADFPWTAAWVGKRVGVDVEARVIRLSDAGRNYVEVPFDKVVRINVEACSAFGLDKLLPATVVYADGFGAEQKLAFYEQDR